MGLGITPTPIFYAVTLVKVEKSPNKFIMLNIGFHRRIINMVLLLE